MKKTIVKSLLIFITTGVSLFLWSPSVSFAGLDEVDRELYECLSASFFLPEKINEFANANASLETVIVGSSNNFAVRLQTVLGGVKGTMTFGADAFTFLRSGKKEVVVSGKSGPRQTLEQILDNRSETIVNYISNELSHEKREKLKGDVRKSLELCNTKTIKETKNTGKLNEILGWNASP